MTSSLDLEHRVVLVTGSSRGIGAAIADSLAAHGASVVLNGRSSEALRARADEISRTHRVACLAAEADVADARQVSAMARTVLSQFGRIDAVVNNAGVLRDGLIGMIGEQDLRDTIDINLIGAVNCIQSFARLMQRNGGGSIVNITSIIGVRGNPGQVVYAASKAGMIGATLAAAKELAPKGIRVNAVAPGYIDTDMIRHIDARTHRLRLDSIAMGRIGQPQDVADVVLFLVSDLSRYVTGQVIGVDGGMLV